MIPVNEPLFGGREKELLAECIDTGWVSSEGPFVSRFEKDFSAYLGAKHGIAVLPGSLTPRRSTEARPPVPHRGGTTL